MSDPSSEESGDPGREASLRVWSPPPRPLIPPPHTALAGTPCPLEISAARGNSGKRVWGRAKRELEGAKLLSVINLEEWNLSFLICKNRFVNPS